MANKVKNKTKSAATKRFKAKKNGSVKRNKAKTSHLFSNKSTKQKRHLRKATTVSKADQPRVKEML